MLEKEHLNRLLPETKKALGKSDKERIEHIKTAKWIPYPAADNVLKTMEDLLVEPEKPRMPNMLIVGESNNGKTSIVREFFRMHPPTNGIDGDAFPVVMVQAPPTPDEGRLYAEILSYLLVPFRDKDPISRHERETVRYLNQIGTRVLIIDEIHNVLSGSVPKQRSFMNALKNIGNKLLIPIVLVGIKDALMAVGTDMQISSRFKPMFLKRWTLNKDYLSLLASIETVMPLKKPSGLTSKETAAEILDLSEGYIGEIMDLTSTAAVKAITTGSEYITLKEIRNCGYVKPSLRRSYEDVENL